MISTIEVFPAQTDQTMETAIPTEPLFAAEDQLALDGASHTITAGLPCPVPGQCHQPDGSWVCKGVC